jgi:hypothetical protein
MNPQDNGDTNEAANKMFLNLAEPDSVTGIPSVNKAPASELHATSKSKVDNQIIIAGVVLLIGVGAVYGMRYLGMAAGLDENAVTIDYASSKPEDAKRYLKVMSALDESSHVMQFGEELDMPDHPFSMDEVADDEIAVIPGMSEEERRALQLERDYQNAAAARENEVMAELYSFDLQGVIGGKRPAARVSGQAVRVGMELGDFFTVVEITGRSVIVEADGKRYELAMGQEAMLVD